MKLFIDSADVGEITEFYSAGIADGVTTNPSLLKKALEKRKGINLAKYIATILTIAKGTPVSLEVTKTSAKEMVHEGITLYKQFNKIARNVVIKIPINTATNGKEVFEGIKAIKKLSDENIPTNATLIFTPEQALLAAKAGAVFVSPFAGRIDDLLRKKNKTKFNKSDYYPAEGKTKGKQILEESGVVSGVDLVAQCVEVLRNYDFKTQVLAASLRNARQVREVALAGADIATINHAILGQMLIHKKTEEGVAKFTKDTVAEYAELIK